ncbi:MULTISPECIES: plasmid recombination protein [Bacteria]|uniref:plasmid recombination protein n=1 Tax=Bacteria TaxID=2 RepID=UPI0025A54C58|nr:MULTISPECIES: plasmid recombination protein [Bacteria]
MTISYSFHISSKSHAVNNIGKVGQVSKHNLREYKSANYDKNLIDVLVGSHDNLLNDIKKVYHQEFNEALEQYNQKQKRADRKINNYLTHVSNSRSDVAVEIIIQIGDKDFWKDIPLSDKKAMSYIFKDQLKALEQYCSNFKIASAVVHYDESSPHMHIVGVPIAKGYEKGMEVQCAKTKVFTKESLSFLQSKMRERAEIGIKLNTELFTNVELKEKEKGRNKDIPKHLLDEYYTLQQNIQSSKEEVEFWQEQMDKYMDKAIQNRDEVFKLEDKSRQLKEKISNQENKLVVNSESLEQQTEEIKRVDSVTQLLAHTEDKDSILENYTIPEKKTLFGKIEAPERQGTFIEGMNKEQVKILMQRVKADDGLQKVYNDIIQKAEKDAKIIRSEATAQKNNTVAKAQEIIKQKNNIIEKAKDWVENQKSNYKDLVDKYNNLAHKFNDLIDKHKRLKDEIDRLEASRKQLEPLKQELEELTRAKQIMSNKLDYEFTKAKFKEWSASLFPEHYDDYRKRGELIALYEDGTIRQVGSNEKGGWDNKTLADKEKGLCRVGVMMEEEHIKVPKSLLREFIQKCNNTVVSSKLKNFIEQQIEVDEIALKYKNTINKI